MAKNIVIFSDGTGLVGGEDNDSNIHKLFLMMEDRTPNQVTFYDPGIGTDWRRVSGMLFGVGLGRNLLQCYREIHKHYESGDQIYLFGFSRGAATVRSLSEFIHLFGILPRSRSELIDQAYKIYKIRNKEKRERKAAEFVKRHATMWTKIRFLGCYDTVAALGVSMKGLNLVVDAIWPHRFHSFALSESVSYARHALAIDESRKNFLPVMWEARPPEEGDRMKQVWFSGAHSDIGGGYYKDDLSSIPLTWMLKEAVDQGLRVYAESPALARLKEQPAGKINGQMHNEQAKFPWRIIKAVDRADMEQNFGKLCFHESVFERTKNQNNESEPAYAPGILAGLDPSDYTVEPWTRDLNFLEESSEVSLQVPFRSRIAANA